MKIRPLSDQIVIRRIQEQDRPVGSLFIPDTAKEKPQQGEVIAVGKGRRSKNGELIPLTVVPGDRILFGKYSGSEIKVDGEECIIMREDEILGILEIKGKLEVARAS